MRTLPVALAYPETKTMLRQSARISAMTHWDPQAEVCCAVYCLWVQGLLEGADRLAAWQTAVDSAKTAAGRGSLAPGETPGPTPLPPLFGNAWNGFPTYQRRGFNPPGTPAM
jgi:hypothetical protein